MLINRNVFFKIGGFNYFYKCSGDRNLLIRLLKSGYKNETFKHPTGHFRATGFSSNQTLAIIRENFYNQWIGYRFDIVGYFLLFLKLIKVLLKK